jgi:hypothetical protein
MKPIFIHIPKVAGRSVINLLVENYGSRSVLVDDSPEIRQRLLQNPYEFDKYEAIAGSIPLYCFQNFCGNGGFLFFALIRNPIHRGSQEPNEQCFYLGGGKRKFSETKKVILQYPNLIVRPLFAVDKLMHELSGRFDWDISDFEWDKESEEKMYMTSSEKKKILEINSEDAKLYEWAKHELA